MLVIRNLRAEDKYQRQRLMGYLSGHPDEGIRVRPDDQIDLAQKSGLILTVERNEQICGCSLVYKFSSDGSVFNEIGTMRVTENGFRLQQTLAQLHIMQMTLEEFYTQSNMIFAVVKAQTGSEHVLKNHVEMKKWDPPPVLIHLRAQAGVSFSEDKYCLVSDDACTDKAFRDLKRLYTGSNIFNTPSGGERLQFVLPWFHDGVLSIRG